MGRELRLTNEDSSAAAELVQLSRVNYRNRLAEFEVDGPIGNLRYCYEAASASLSAANQLGIEAGWELHLGHAVLSLSPNENMPAPDDPILCMTWGQFLTPEKSEALAPNGVCPYFGEREGIRQLMSGGALRRRYYYGLLYSPASFVMRGVIDSEMPGRILPILHGKRLFIKKLLLDHYYHPDISL